MKISTIQINKNGLRIDIGGETELDRQALLKMDGDYVARITVTRDPVYKTEQEPLGPAIGVSIGLVRVKRRK